MRRFYQHLFGTKAKPSAKGYRPKDRRVVARRATLTVEGLEDRMVLSTATPASLTLVISADVEARVHRITNVRANATVLSGGSAAGATPVIASISVSGPSQ
jgi:hypothetical protein